jgi:hypothetical protein
LIMNRIAVVAGLLLTGSSWTMPLLVSAQVRFI